MTTATDTRAATEPTDLAARRQLAPLEHPVGPPTEAEIRKAIADRLAFGVDGEIDTSLDGDMPKALRYWAERLGETFTGPLYELVNGTHDTGESDEGPWVDLRPSEAKRIGTLVKDALDVAVPAAQAMIVDALTKAALTFAAEHPDAPRGARPAMCP